jgi:3-oxoacyl-[acyl-carrier-protein] synthase II
LNKANKVAITGLGAVTPVGIGVDASWDSIKNGRHGFAPITRFDVSGLKVSMNAEVKGYQYPDKREERRLDLFVQYGLTAAAEALEMSGLVPDGNVAADRVGAYVGSGIGGISTLESEIMKGQERGLNRVSPLLAPMIIGNMLPGWIAIKFGVRGSAIDIVTACACGTNAIGEAMRAIEAGYLDAVLAGGAEAPFAPVTYAGFDNMTAMSRRTDADRCSTPFDKERDGFVMGEGAGILVLENYDMAKSRGAKILATVVGYGSTSDGFHITAPDETAAGPAKAMQMALDSAGLAAGEIDYINAHGTSTPANDRVETLAIKKVFGKTATVPVSSTKSMTGHLLGGAGGIEAIFTVKAIADSLLPPTIGLRVPDPELDLDYVSGDAARAGEISYAMSNSLGFGGHNGSIIFAKE